MSFDDLNLHPSLLEVIEKQGYETPSPIQEKAIPVVLKGKDVMAAAQTGTGKTDAFGLPLVQRLAEGKKAGRNETRSLILTPTRELAAQVCESIKGYAAAMNLNCAVVYGGVKINPQILKLRLGNDILVATPGRLLDLYNQKAIDFSKLECLILDEADRMLDMGFIHDIRKIIKALPANRQNLMFSATFSKDIRRLAEGILHNPVNVDVSPRNSTAVTVKQWIHLVDKSRKSELLAHLIWDMVWDPVLIFTRTKHGADRLVKKLEREKIPSLAIHGNKSQGARTRALNSFKTGKIRALVATDIAARGIDIDQLPQVVNFDLPSVAEDYVHRIGRTGRAGMEGQAISLVCLAEEKQLADIERLINVKLERIPVAGFETTETKETVAKDKTKQDEQRQKMREGRKKSRERKAKAVQSAPAKPSHKSSDKSASTMTKATKSDKASGEPTNQSKSNNKNRKFSKQSKQTSKNSSQNNSKRNSQNQSNKKQSKSKPK